MDHFCLQEFEEVLKEANLTDSLELLGLTVEEGKLGEAVQEGEEGKEVITKMEQSYAASMQQVSRAVPFKYCFRLDHCAQCSMPQCKNWENCFHT